MLSTLLVMAVIIAVGTRASDGLEVRQQEVILANLPEAEAVAYYQILRRRLRKVMVLRAIALLALVAIIYAYKHRFAA
jgi:hypothetical protein